MRSAAARAAAPAACGVAPDGGSDPAAGAQALARRERAPARKAERRSVAGLPAPAAEGVRVRAGGDMGDGSPLAGARLPLVWVCGGRRAPDAPAADTPFRGSPTAVPYETSSYTLRQSFQSSHSIGLLTLK